MTRFIIFIFILRNAQACSNENDLIFAEDYNLAEPPMKPQTNVEVSLSFKAFDEVNDSQKSFTFTSVIELKWQEDRIRIKNPKFNHIRKPRTFSTCIWSPSLTFRGQVALTQVENVNNDLDILIANIANFSVQIEMRLQVKVKINCPHFDFHWFPLDQEFCSVVLFSRDTSVRLEGEIHEVKTFDMDQAPLAYKVENKTLGQRDDATFKNTGYSYFGTRIHFTRKLPPFYGYVIWTETVVWISWITYWVPYLSYPGRLGPLVTLFLTLVNTFIKIRGVVPTCMDSTSILEMYIIACIFQVLFVMLGYAHILITIQIIKSKVSTVAMDPKIIEEQKIKKINRFYQIASPIVNVCIWVFITLYTYFHPGLDLEL